MAEYRARSGQQREDRIHAVRIGVVSLVIPHCVEVMIGRDVVIAFCSEEPAIVFSLRLKREIVAVVIVAARNAIAERARGGRRQLDVVAEDITSDPRTPYSR